MAFHKVGLFFCLVLQDNTSMIRPGYLLHEDYAFYGYKVQYSNGDIILMASLNDTKGLLPELKVFQLIKRISIKKVESGVHWFTD